MPDDLDKELIVFLGSPQFAFPKEEETPDAVGKLFEAANIDALAKEPIADGLSTRAVKTAARIDAPDSTRLAKGFSADGAKVWFQNQITATGSTASEVLKRWRAEYPHASADVVDSLEWTAVELDGEGGDE